MTPPITGKLTVNCRFTGGKRLGGSLAGQTRTRRESLVLYHWAFGSAESATSSIFTGGGLPEINALILHCRKASLNKLLTH